MRCIIVDDEPLSREGLERYVARVGFLEHAGSFENALQASEALQKLEVNLIFLDIQMPYMTGIDFLKNLIRPPLVIFHTAFPNFALESYQLDVIDYLVKPITFERFFKAVNKAHEYFTLRNDKTRGEAGTVGKEFIFIKCENRYEKVEFAKILFIEGMQNYAILQLTDDKLMTLMTLKSLEDILPESAFFRIHKSYIVNLNNVKSIDGNRVRVGDRMIPFSKIHKETIFNRLVRNK